MAQLLVCPTQIPEVMLCDPEVWERASGATARVPLPRPAGRGAAHTAGEVSVLLGSLGQPWGGAGPRCCPAFLSAGTGGREGLRNGAGVLPPSSPRGSLAAALCHSRSVRALAGRPDPDQPHF